MTRNFVFGCLAFFVLLSSAAAQAPASGTATDPLIGIWKLNLEKSTPRPPPGVTAVRRYLLRSDGYMVTLGSGTTEQGGPAFNEAVWKYDGKDYAMYVPETLADFSVNGTKPPLNSYRAIDAYTSEVTLKDNTGKITSVRTRVVSKDGRTLTDASAATNAAGQSANASVWDRVQ